MQLIKRSLKQIFKITGSLSLLDTMIFHLSRIKNWGANKRFMKTNPGFRLPPDYFLYETYQLNYRQYKEDGWLAAKEIIEWTDQYTPANKKILDWGCGVARTVRHLHHFINEKAEVFACDINREMIDWGKANIPGVNFERIGYDPPTPYMENTFDLVYALSVFTHIEGGRQAEWLQEMARILKPGGIFLFTTHGRRFFDKLTGAEQQSLKETGSYTISYHQKGHRMMTTFNEGEKFRQMAGQHFTVLEFHDGLTNPGKVGGQDLWIVQKR